MYESKGTTHQRMKRILNESKRQVSQLYMTPCLYSRNTILHKLGSNMEELDRLCNIQNREIYENREPRQRDFTSEELSKYTGKAGNPAYVAVNGIVYDVTNSAAWAAATHFGLTAGKDLTGAFASCHVGQPVLDKLKPVGKLI
jgi:predicted heme/steroid binding protein